MSADFSLEMLHCVLFALFEQKHFRFFFSNSRSLFILFAFFIFLQVFLTLFLYSPIESFITSGCYTIALKKGKKKYDGKYLDTFMSRRLMRNMKFIEIHREFGQFLKSNQNNNNQNWWNYFFIFVPNIVIWSTKRYGLSVCVHVRDNLPHISGIKQSSRMK